MTVQDIFDRIVRTVATPADNPELLKAQYRAFPGQFCETIRLGFEVDGTVKESGDQAEAKQLAGRKNLYPAYLEE